MRGPPGLRRWIPWMKVLRRPCLNRTVVSVAVDTTINLARAFSLSAMAALPFSRDVCAPAAPCQSHGVNAQAFARRALLGNRIRPRAGLLVAAAERVPISERLPDLVGAGVPFLAPPCGNERG